MRVPQVQQEAVHATCELLEESAVAGQPLGAQRLDDVVEGEQSAVLLQRVLTLHGRQKGGDELRPFPRTVQPVT